MKRFLSVLLVAVFAVTLGFAQDFKLSGYLNYGLGVEFSSNDDADFDARFRVAGVDSEQRSGRFRLNGAYSNEAKTAGADLRIQFQGAAANSRDNLGLAYAYGWIKPLDMLLVKAGLVADSTFETGGSILRDDAGSGAGAGIFVKLTPIEGLDVGVGIYPRSADGGNNNNRIQGVDTWGEWYDVKYTFGVGYTMPDVFKFTASFRSSNDAGVSSRTQARAIGEVRLLMVENLTAIFELEVDNIFNKADESDLFKNDGKINIFETVAYKIDALSFGLNAAQYLSNKDKSDMSLRFNPWVSYALDEGKIVPRLDGVFFLGGDRNTSGGDAFKYDRRSDVSPTYDSDQWILNVRPSIKINLDSRTSFEIGDVFYYRNPAKGDGFMDNVFYVDLVVRF